MATGFSGFGPKALPFFKALAFHQSKAWFDENRPLYDRDVVAPMLALLDDLTAAFAQAGLPLKAAGKRSIFRINRDIRFSADKRPYKTHCGAVLTQSGAKNDAGLLYVHVDPEGCFVAAGFYRPEPDELLRLRKAILKDARGFTAMTATLAGNKLALSTENALARLPRGFEDAKGSTVEQALRLRSFTVDEPLPARLIASAKLTGTIVGFAERAAPLLRFGWKALGRGSKA